VPISILDFVPKSASSTERKPHKLTDTSAQPRPYSSGKPGTFETTQAKKHRSAKAAPAPKVQKAGTDSRSDTHSSARLNSRPANPLQGNPWQNSIKPQGDSDPQANPWHKSTK